MIIILMKTLYKKITKKTKQLCPVHWSGRPCELDKLRIIAKRNNLKIIQDTCHGIDAKFKK